MEDYGIDSDLKKFPNSSQDNNMIHQKYWFDLVLRALHYLQAFSLMVIAISGSIGQYWSRDLNTDLLLVHRCHVTWILISDWSGFCIYLLYLNRSENTSRILNNLNGFLASDGIFISLLKFLHLILVDYLSEDIPIMCLLDICRHCRITSPTFFKHFLRSLQCSRLLISLFGMVTLHCLLVFCGYKPKHKQMKIRIPWAPVRAKKWASLSDCNCTGPL